MHLTSEEKILKTLAKLKLRVPSEVKSYILENENTYNHTPAAYDCLEVMEKWRGYWILRVFAFHVDRKTDKCTQLQEVQRKVIGCKQYLTAGNIVSSMNGRRIIWGNEVRFYPTKQHWEFHGLQLYDTNEVINDLDAKYCAFDQYKGYLRFVDYMTIYLNEPRIERLVKEGYSRFIQNVRYLDLSQRRIYKVFKLEKQWEENLSHMSISEIFIARKKSIKDYDHLMKFKKYKNCLSYYKYIKKYISFELYLKNKQVNTMDNYDYQYLNDYLRFAETLGYPLYKKEVLLPKNIKKEHDRLSKEYADYQESLEIEKTKNLNNDIFKQYLKNEKHNYTNGPLFIKVVESNKELIEESSKLNHCVRTYVEQIADGTSEILVIRNKEKPKDPFYTVEVVKNKITQVRGKNNKPADDLVKDFVTEWSVKNKLKYINSTY